MKYYLFFKDGDNSVESAMAQSGEIHVAENHWAIETTIDVYNTFQNYLQSEEDFLNKKMILQNGQIQLVERNYVPCSINKTTITADGSDFIKISNIPLESRILVKGITEFICNDGEFILTTKIPSEFTIRVTTPYFRYREYNINAT